MKKREIRHNNKEKLWHFQKDLKKLNSWNVEILRQKKILYATNYFVLKNVYINFYKTKAYTNLLSYNNGQEVSRWLDQRPISNRDKKDSIHSFT